MKKTTCKLLSLLLLLCMAVGFLSSCNLKFWEKEDTFTPILRFAVISDIHTRVITEKDATQDEVDDAARRTASLFSSTYRYAENEAYKGVDAVIVVGDYTDDGMTAQYDAFFETVNNNLQNSTKLLACLGNHEFRDTKENGLDNTEVSATYARFSQYFGYDADSVNVIGGYYFIGVSADKKGGRGISQSKAEWLDAQIATAAAADSTGKKPIFVFGHLPSSQTTLGSFMTAGGDGEYDVKAMDEVLQKYPQVVFMAGHTHANASDPASIYQKYFTAIGTGTFAYGEYPIYTGNGSTQTYGIQLTPSGSYQNGLGDEYNEHGERESDVFTIVELDQKNRVRLRYYNADADAFVGDPVIIDSVGSVEDFTFNETRKETSEMPSFPSALTVRSLSSESLIVNIPNATCKDYVRNYRVDLYQDGNCIKTIYRLACQNQLPLPIQITASFSDLTPNTEYEVQVYAYNAYGIMSAPLSLTVKTPEDAGANVKPDVFSFSVKEDGTVVDAVTGTQLRTTGTPAVAYDETLGMTVASFDGTGSYDYDGIRDYYDILKTGFTFEIVGKVPAKPTESYVNLVSGQQDGGFGFELATSGMASIYTSVMKSSRTASYSKVNVKLPVGEYFHLTATYDGSYLKLYLNGEYILQTISNGTVWFPIKESAWYLSVGGDAALEGKTEHFMTGNIAVANVYSTVLTAEEIASKYNALPIQ